MASVKVVIYKNRQKSLKTMNYFFAKTNIPECRGLSLLLLLLLLLILLSLLLLSSLLFIIIYLSFI